ncbi:MAG: hypothetical protein ACFFAH_04055 [Promethearchaeota archaeon]
MEDINLEQVYKIDKARLYSYYERIRNQNSDLEPLQIIAKFLNTQSIGEYVNDIFNVLNYYKTKIKKNILDFAYEWIRAQKIRFEYKKYLLRAQFPNYELAIDECIYSFFLKYDRYIRKLLKNNIKEYEISALYEIFFNPFDKMKFKISLILDKHKNKVPTIFRETKRLNTKIMTLRSALSEIIRNDYESTFKKS